MDIVLCALAAACALAHHPGSTIQVVVARYAEDLSWLSRPPFDGIGNVVVYNKGPTRAGCRPGMTVIRLPNVGREGHTFLHHICENYDNLADTTIFLPGSCASQPQKWARTMWTVRHARRTNNSAFPDQRLPKPLHEAWGDFVLDEYVSTDPSNAAQNPESELLPSPQRPFGAWLRATDMPEVDGVTIQGVFAVSREHIRQKPLVFYRRLLGYLDHHSNPEAGHFMERSWLAAFSPVPPSCRHSATLRRPNKS